MQNNLIRKNVGNFKHDLINLEKLKTGDIKLTNFDDSLLRIRGTLIILVFVSRMLAWKASN